jgi:hypothetical protein
VDLAKGDRWELLDNLLGDGPVAKSSLPDRAIQGDTVVCPLTFAEPTNKEIVV